MKQKGHFLALGVALALRLSGVGWDGFTHQHPDERFLVMVAENLALPRSFTEALSPNATPLNPQNRGFRFFVYGSLFPTLNLLLAELTGKFTYQGLLRTGRVLSALLDGVTLLLLWHTAKRLAGAKAALWLAWLYAFCGLCIQHARFGTTDALGLTLVALTLVFALKEVSWTSALGAGLSVGLAAACRPNLATLAVPVIFALLFLPSRFRHRPALARLVALGGAGLAAVAMWKLGDPGFFSGTFSLAPNPRRWASFRELASQLQGLGQFPPNLQWVGRGPFFLFWNLFFWGLGPALGLSVLLALARSVRRLALGDRRLWLLAGWPLLLFTCQARGLVVSVRHSLPVVPFLLLLLAVIASRWAGWQRWAVLALTVPWGLAWASVPWQPYSRLEASRFMARAIPQGAVVAVESWDDALPLGPHQGQYRFREIPAYEPDTPEKRERLLAILREVQVIALSSQRAVGSICRVPDAYPVTAEFYHLLFRGELGFRLVFAREPKLGWGRLGFSLLTAEEALSVYDQPPVWLFLKEASYNHTQVATLLHRLSPASNSFWDTRDLEARGLPPYLVRTSPMPPSPPAWPKNFWGQAAALCLWLLFLELVAFAGAAALERLRLPLPFVTLLARPLGNLLVGMTALWLGSLRIPGWRVLLPWGVLLAVFFTHRSKWRRLLTSPEALLSRWLFLFPFGFFLLVRALNPEIYWGEKPMDFAIFMTLLRTPSLPPSDPWFAGYPINYYFFGFLPLVTATGATLTPPAVAFNLATATVPALTCLAAAAVGWGLSRRGAGAFLAALLVQGVGTAHLLFSPSDLLTPTFEGFWASSRVIAGTINEYPIWTALFADLHAHFLSFPGFCTALALLIASLLWERQAFSWLLGLVLAAQFMSNSWELPALVLLTCAASYLRSARKTHAFARSLPWLATVCLSFALAIIPFVVTQTFPSGRLFREQGAPWSWGQLELYGIHGIVFLLALILGLRHLPPPLRWFCAAGGLLALGLIAGPQFFTLQDKMNTYFKLGLQVYLLLGSLAGGLLGAALGSYLGQLARAALGFVSLLLAVGMVESLWATWAVCHTRRVPGPRPTLDGEAYLWAVQPQLAACLPWLRELPARAVGEAWEPPYSDTLRVPMFTGLPTVVGWEYHLWQRGKSPGEIRQRAADLQLVLARPEDPLGKVLARRWDLDVLVPWEKPQKATEDFVPWGDGWVLVRRNLLPGQPRPH
ncbi:MAG: DUF2298 domain-containing protein [Thermoanaerobaculaceae bacterium]